MTGLIQDLRYGLRTFARGRGFAAVAVLTMALGIGATTAVYSVVDGVLLKPLPFDRPEQVVTVAIARQDGQFGLSGGVMMFGAAHQAPPAALRPMPAVVSAGRRSMSVDPRERSTYGSGLLTLGWERTRRNARALPA